MAARIKIKRSGSTITPTTLAPGELAYSWANATGGKLYIGAGNSIANNQAEFVNVIGGKYFTDKLDHTSGVLTPNSAIITDSNNRIDRLFVDNVLLDGNLISANGDLILTSTGIISASNRRFSNVAAPISSTDAVNLGYVESVYSGFLQITGDTGSDSIRLLSDVIDFNGGIGVSTVVTANTVTFNLTSTGVVANTYGTANSVSSFSVNSQGRITSAVNTPIAIPSTQVTDFVEATQDAIAASLAAGTQSGLTITYDDSLGTLSFNVNDPVITLAGDIAGSATMNNLGNVTINTTIQANSVALGADTTGDYIASIIPGTGVTITNNTGESATPTISIGQNVSTTANVVFNNVTVNGTLNSDDITAANVTVAGNLIVSGTTTTINTETINLADNIIVLNSNLSQIPPIENAGIEINRGSSANTTFLWNETFDYWTTGSFPIHSTGGFIGNASSATILQNTRTISFTGDVVGSFTFNGSANTSASLTIQPNSVELGTDTTGNYVALVSNTASSGVLVTGTPGEGATFTIAGINATNTVKGVASFGGWADSANTVRQFVLDNGDVAIINIDGGSY